MPYIIWENISKVEVRNVGCKWGNRWERIFFTCFPFSVRQIHRLMVNGFAPWQMNTHSPNTFLLLSWWAWATLAGTPWAEVSFGERAISGYNYQVATDKAITDSRHNDTPVRSWRWGQLREIPGGVRFSWCWFAVSHLVTSRAYMHISRGVEDK